MTDDGLYLARCLQISRQFAQFGRELSQLTPLSCDRLHAGLDYLGATGLRCRSIAVLVLWSSLPCAVFPSFCVLWAVWLVPVFVPYGDALHTQLGKSITIQIYRITMTRTTQIVRHKDYGNSGTDKTRT